MIAHLTISLALIVAQTGGQPAATPPPRPCVTPAEAGAGAAVMLPEFVDALGRSCAPHLSDDVYLRAHGGALVERWRSEATSQRAMAMAGMARMSVQIREVASGEAQAPRDAAQAEAGVQAMIGGLTASLSDRLTPVTCKELSRFVEAIAPLPARNVAQMVSAIMGFGVAMSPPGADGPPICRP